jgi:hypothetical protein
VHVKSGSSPGDCLNLKVPLLPLVPGALKMQTSQKGHLLLTTSRPGGTRRAAGGGEREEKRKLGSPRKGLCFRRRGRRQKKSATGTRPARSTSAAQPSPPPRQRAGAESQRRALHAGSRCGAGGGARHRTLGPAPTAVLRVPKPRPFPWLSSTDLRGLHLARRATPFPVKKVRARD